MMRYNYPTASSAQGGGGVRTNRTMQKPPSHSGYGHRGTMGTGQVTPKARGTMGTGEYSPKAKGVMGRG